MKAIPFFALLCLCFLLNSGASSLPGSKTMKGELLPDTDIYQMAQDQSLCQVDSGEGYVLSISQDHKNPLFESKAPNRIHLLVHFPEAPQAGKRYQLPDSGIQTCYWEKGDLLMFKTFESTGWIEFSAIKPGKSAQGSMEIQLIKPFHNMSTSDFHYMGGKFKLKLPASAQE